MDQRFKANILIDRAEVVLSNLLALTGPDKEYFRVPVTDVVVSLETGISLLREAQYVTAGLASHGTKNMLKD